MRVEVVAFFVLFGLFFGVAELTPWLREGVWSTPLLMGAGVLLAIASNQPKGHTAPRLSPPEQPTPPKNPATTNTTPPPPPTSPNPTPSALRTGHLRPSGRSPQVAPAPEGSISFTIKKSQRHPKAPTS